MGGNGEDSVVSLAAADGIEVVGRKATTSVACRANDARQASAFSEPGGSPFIAVLLGLPRGRWTAELDGHSRACQSARAAVVSSSGQSHLRSPPRSPGVVSGVVAFRGWRYVTGAASHCQTFALVEACEAFHRRRSGHRFMEHEILLSAALLPDSASTIDVDSAWLRGPADSGSLRMAADLAKLSDLSLVATKGDQLERSLPLQALLARWRSILGAASCELVAWPVDWRLAAAMATGGWWGDVSVKHRRQLPGEITLAPVRPSDVLLRQFLEHRVDKVCAPLPVDLVWDDKRGCSRSFHPEHILLSARLGQHVSAKANLGRVLQAAWKWHAPTTWLALSATSGRTLADVPTANTQRRHIVRLDMASMLAHRFWYKANGPTFRYLSFDASPQHGYEYFVSVERVVRRADVQQLPAGQWPVVDSRHLPLGTLGCGRMGLAEKIQAHTHQIWLDYGPSVDDVRAANRDVRQCLSDMGTELAIGDAPDCVASSLEQPAASSSSDASWLYPLALTVPGPQHILDTCLTKGLESLEWWPEWQGSAKNVCQWVRPGSRRALLSQILRDAAGDPEVLAGRLQALSNGCQAFASWRWKTLATVTKDLSRLADPVRSVAAIVASAAELSAKDGGAAASFLANARNPQFWSRNSMLQELTGPIDSFASWLRGCPCHEAERIQGRKVQCQWAGCRAPALASRLDRALEELQHIRDKFWDAPDMVAAVNVILGNLRMKMGWVWEEPYLVWRADDAAIAQQMLDKHDAMVALGLVPHRVTSYLCGAASSSLRSDMLAHALGGQLSERLRIELQAYSMCKIDDTWAEAAHRDVSCMTKRAARVKPVYVSAKQRLAQTLDSVDRMSCSERHEFHRCLRRFKAVGQSNPERAAALIAPRQTLKAIAGKVYRCDDSALRNWGRELGNALGCLAIDQPNTKRSLIARLQIEYLHSVVVEGQMLSLPVVTESILDQLEQAQSGDHAAFLSEQQLEDMLFVVVDKTAGRKKRLKTTSCPVSHMACPVTLQRVRRVGPASATVASKEAYQYGCPELLDLLPLAGSWLVWRFGLRQWHTTASPEQGRLVLVDSAPVVATADWKSPHSPTLQSR